MQTLSSDTLAKMAVELHIAEQRNADADLEPMVFALWLEASAAAKRVDGMALLSARIGLSDEAIARILGDEYRHAEIIGKAHRLIKNMIGEGR